MCMNIASVQLNLHHFLATDLNDFDNAIQMITFSADEEGDLDLHYIIINTYPSLGILTGEYFSLLHNFI